MKSLTMRFAIAAAAFVAAAGVASAQTMEAKIPFAFHASGKALPAGTYRVTLKYGSSSVPTVKISNRGTGESSLTMALAGTDPQKAWVAFGNAVLLFQCGSSACALQQVWMGDTGSPSYRVPMPKGAKEDYRITAEVVMHRTASE